ncbi:MAG: hypothetical protein DMF21_05940 [Verrucomicrobia bacterium]|nr:MAG: hypothetical protein DMF21_05940 [Verrucomicrobiota bacterium]
MQQLLISRLKVRFLPRSPFLFSNLRAENLQPLIFDQWLCRSVFFRFCRIFKYVPKIDIVWLCPKTYPDFSTRQDLYNRWIQLHRQDRTSSR